MERTRRDMIPYEKTTDECLKKMFAMVGEEYPNQELTSKENWFHQRTWTSEQENEFRIWMRKLLKRRYKHWTKRVIDGEISGFLFMWGWKVNQ